ncbi:peptide/nickel transport system permease protein [Halanaerobium saccharolyticum]|uniref:Peptide/nickel transport system permease protein n=1 Tax=Halanaerobium saccharolyticum TaxID=43595 RepID=A0A4R7Z1S4_9FIRM|nr:ABC transporter permease [Halanaerobium saccharolyticum]RAK06885.1 peptide/nickel transport system permease protein [Halanaerobium saccharolyticum]TDW01495.1 peptide/nickel transport system permease protein [Halanaerobium saccharolyticum]TDX52856.1 peptide/nickel transport system permease protein [Halanaerobium saccharolyticum]
MFNYITRRVAVMIPVLILISMFIFFIIQLPPGNYLDSYVALISSQGETISGERVEKLEERYGLNQPVYVKYWKWVKGFVFLDFGNSFQYDNASVWSIVKAYLGYSILIAGSTQIFMIVVGIPIGIYSATHQYSFGDYFWTILGFIGLSIPNFMLALILMYVGYFVFGIPSLGGLFSEQYITAPWSIAKFIDLLQHLWIPVVVLGTAGTAGVIRTMRANLLDVLNMQYISTARAKGLKESVVIYKHAVRNALHVIIMWAGMRLPKLISGSTVVSIVLSLPTLGPIIYTALRSQDMYLAGTVLLFQCVLLLVGNLIADIILAVVDPRIQYN